MNSILLLILCLGFLPMGKSRSFWNFDWQELGMNLWSTLKNPLGREVCSDEFIAPNFNKLRSSLHKMLFGQEIIIKKMVPLLESHFNNEPKKALVISMHGWTGSGKNYATKIIIDNMFEKKSDSKFVRYFNGRLHFPLDTKDAVNQYKINLQEWVRGNVSECSRTIFVFDEVDKIAPGIIDGIKPYFDYHDKIDSIDYRKSIFIFISNIGAEVINSQYLSLWRQGKFREDMEYTDFEPYLKESLYNTKGGFKESSVLDGHLVSLYLPFLPLQEEQVRKCIEVEIRRQNIGPVDDEHIEYMLNEMEFNEETFSTSGCKRVADIVATHKYRVFDEL